MQWTSGLSPMSTNGPAKSMSSAPREKSLRFRLNPLLSEIARFYDQRVLQAQPIALPCSMIGLIRAATTFISPKQHRFS
jgi:hypothetical protein